jgi:glycosyltransferase involved in cell wall biosynthesis
MGYRSNLSLRRMLNHRGIARKFTVLAEEETEPDVILCSFPTVELSRAATEYGRERGIPVVLDVRDLWPDVFLDMVPPRARPLAHILLRGMFKDTRTAFRRCTSIVAVSQGYLDWALRYANREQTKRDLVFPLGYKRPSPTAEQLRRAETKFNELGVEPSKVVCWFVGIFGRTYDLEIIIDVARHLQERGVDHIQFVFCGDGDYRATWEARSFGLANVIFTGWVDASEIAYMARISSIGLAAYAAGAPQGLPNKIFEYLAAGLPVLFSLKGEAQQLLQENECGIEYDPMARATFLAGLETLAENRDLRIRMGENAKQLFEDSYSSERIYPRLMDHLFGVARRHVAT